MKEIKADLHMHTRSSDGEKAVEELIDLVKNANLNYFSITDHDTLRGSLYAYDIINNYKNLNLILGLELSTELKGESIHILGYFNYSSKLLELEEKLELQRQMRVKRAHKIFKALKKYFDIDLDYSFMDDIYTITRGTIAKEIVNQGFPYTVEEIFDNMIGHNCKAYYPSTKLTTEEGIKLIKDYGGIAVLAHPCLLKKVKVEELIKLGFDGIEAIYPLNTIEQEIEFKKIAKDNNLLITAGSDFHRFDDHQHGSVGSVFLKDADLQLFLEKLAGM